jgi:hypothetical protein
VTTLEGTSLPITSTEHPRERPSPLPGLEVELVTVAAAADQFAAAQQVFADAVVVARLAGHGWEEIAEAMDVSPQTAEEMHHMSRRGLPGIRERCTGSR